jgi:transcriptional regulator with XRE-family HTH domain
LNLKCHEDVAHMSIGENLSKIREKAGLTQAQVAKMADIPLPTYKKYESGSQSPPGDRIRTLAIALGTSADEIVMEFSERDISQDLKAIFMRYDKLPEEMRHIARFTLKGLLMQMESDMLEGDWYEKNGLTVRNRTKSSD